LRATTALRAACRVWRGTENGARALAFPASGAGAAHLGCRTAARRCLPARFPVASRLSRSCYSSLRVDRNLPSREPTGGCRFIWRDGTYDSLRVLSPSAGTSHRLTGFLLTVPFFSGLNCGRFQGRLGFRRWNAPFFEAALAWAQGLLLSTFSPPCVCSLRDSARRNAFPRAAYSGAILRRRRLAVRRATARALGGTTT